MDVTDFIDLRNRMDSSWKALQRVPAADEKIQWTNFLHDVVFVQSHTDSV